MTYRDNSSSRETPTKWGVLPFLQGCAVPNLCQASQIGTNMAQKSNLRAKAPASPARPKDLLPLKKGLEKAAQRCHKSSK